ncbi:MAG: DUF445 family protein [Peptoniphilus lacrimalis]|uniref:DUF445 domain-containing protein n=1 Tax=Peptoniphilus lacrimalis TaxID=33031 RepID=UPI00254EB138|nr:DUF445 family protein [Peptoniphilus lacrimalis]MDK8282704.1 DUF445 family protein [Peptoniphilus lacrimalis]
METTRILFIIIISGLIGYFTNVLAIRCLFRPYEKIKLGPFIFQGLIPKRKDEIAEQIGIIVAKEFVQEDDIIGQLISQDDEIYFRSFVSDKIKSIVLEKTSFLPESIQFQLVKRLNEKVEKESPKAFNDFKELAENQIREKIDLQVIIEEKIKELDLKEIEVLVLQVASNELKAIEILGLIMGLAIGIIQALVSLYLL